MAAQGLYLDGGIQRALSEFTYDDTLGFVLDNSDFRIAGDLRSKLFFVDESADQIFIGWASTLPSSSYRMTIQGGIYVLDSETPTSQTIVDAGYLEVSGDLGSGFLSQVEFVFSDTVGGANSVQILPGLIRFVDTVYPFVGANNLLSILSTGYINFGANEGDTGYGIRTNLGTLEYKANTASDWRVIPEVPTGAGELFFANASGELVIDSSLYFSSGFLYAPSLAVGSGTDISTVTDSAIGVQNSSNASTLTPGYLNYGSTTGASGYGLRDNNGAIQAKNSGGIWQDVVNYQVLSLGSNFTSANTTLGNLTGMSFNYLANSTYVFELYLRISSAAATTGHRIAVDCSTAVTDVAVHFIHQLATTGTITGGSGIGDATSSAPTTGLPNTSSWLMIGSGILVTSSNAGSAQFQHASEVAANATVLAGSKIVVRKVE